jgi:hypothetical protein
VVIYIINKKEKPMKNLILFALLIPFSLFAQIQVEDRKAAMNSETEEWMVKISSDSEMRIQMMDMIVEETKGNVGEMNKLANSISNNPEMVKIILDANPERAGSDDFSVEPLGLKKDGIKVGKTTGTQPVAKPKQ